MHTESPHSFPYSRSDALPAMPHALNVFAPRRTDVTRMTYVGLDPLHEHFPDPSDHERALRKIANITGPTGSGGANAGWIARRALGVVNPDGTIPEGYVSFDVPPMDGEPAAAWKVKGGTVGATESLTPSDYISYAREVGGGS